MIATPSGKQYPRRSRSGPLRSPGVRTHLPGDGSVPRVGYWQAVLAVWDQRDYVSLGSGEGLSSVSAVQMEGDRVKLHKLTTQIPRDCCMLEYVVSGLCYLSLALNKFPI